MASAREAQINWIFNRTVDPTPDLKEMLVAGEEIKVCYATVRDIAMLTNKRIVIRDKQGLTGKKIETYSLPFRSIDMWSIENAGRLDLTAEVELWTKAGHFKINLKKGADIQAFNDALAEAIL